MFIYAVATLPSINIVPGQHVRIDVCYADDTRACFSWKNLKEWFTTLLKGIPLAIIFRQSVFLLFTKEMLMMPTRCFVA